MPAFHRLSTKRSIDRCARLLERAAPLLLVLVPGAVAAQDEPEEGDHVRRRFEYFYEQRAYPLDEIPLGALQRAYADLRLRFPRVVIPGGAAAAAGIGDDEPVWSALGPILISSEDAGRASTIALHPTDLNTIYIGGAQGGVWRTTDGGATWVPLTDHECSLAMGHIAIDPVAPEIIYAGTGELHFSGDSYYGCGILRSVDGGVTWTQQGAEIFDTNTGGARVAKIIIEPGTEGSTTSTTLYAATSFGLYRSTDSGQSWTELLNGIITDVVQHPTSLDTIYAAMSTTASNAQNGVYRTTDRGVTWTRLSTGFASSDIGRVQIAMAPSDPRIIYASVQDGFDGDESDGELLGLWYTSNGGNSWSRRSANNLNCGPQCWYDQAITVDPIDPARLYFGGVSLFRSLDGGFNFQDVRRGIHVDQHAIVVDPRDNQRVYVANDGGIFRSDNAGGNWTSINGNLSITQFYPGISLHPTDPGAVLGGTQDNGTVEFEGLPSWDRVLGADGGFTGIDYITPSFAYAETQWRAGSSFAGPRRRDGFGGFTRRVAGIDVDDRALFIPPLVMDPTDPTVLYFGTYRVYRTANRADLWTAISPDLSRSANGRVSAIAPSPSDPQTVYVGTSDGNLRVTTNGGASWQQRRTGIPNRFVTDIAVNRDDPAIALLTVSGFGTGHVFRTEDGGVSWQDISGDLPDMPVNAVLAPSLLGGDIYIGTDLGVMRSEDGGTTWQPLQLGMPNVAVFDLAYGPATGRLIAATHGRGMFAYSPVAAASVTIDTDSVHFNSLADTIQLAAAATAPDGGDLPNPPVAWLALDPSVAEVDINGVLRSLGNGETKVIAALAGAADTIPVVVRQIVAEIAGLVERDSIVVGEQKLLIGRAVDANGQTVADAVPSWTTSNSDAVEVDASGRIVGVDLGEAIVALEVESLRDSTRIRVESPATLSLTVVALPVGSAPRSDRDSRFPLLALTLGVDGIEPVRLTAISFDVRGQDPEARLELINDVDADGAIGLDDLIVRTAVLELTGGAPVRVDLAPTLTVFESGSMHMLVALRMSGQAPNGAAFEITYVPDQTESVGVRSGALNRLQAPGSPVVSALVLTTVLQGEAPYGISENPVFQPSVSFNFAVDATVTRAAVFTVTGRPVIDLLPFLSDATVEWSLTNADGSRVQPGVYLVVFEIDGAVHTEKLIVLRRDEEADAAGSGTVRKAPDGPARRQRR